MNKENLTSIKYKIKAEIESRKISIYKLANDAGVSETCIRNWFGKRDYTPSIYSLEKVCKALDLSLSQLLLDTNEKMYPLNKQETNLMKSWNTLSPKDKDLILLIMQNLIDR